MCVSRKGLLNRNKPKRALRTEVKSVDAREKTELDADAEDLTDAEGPEEWRWVGLLNLGESWPARRQLGQGSRETSQGWKIIIALRENKNKIKCLVRPFPWPKQK